MTTPTPQQILDLPLEDNDADAATVRDYLVALLSVIWDDGHDLSPFGNSGWEWDLYRALVKAGYASTQGWRCDGTGDFCPDHTARQLSMEDA